MRDKDPDYTASSFILSNIQQCLDILTSSILIPNLVLPFQKADPTQFMQVHGRKSKIHLDPAVAIAGDSATIMQVILQSALYVLLLF